MTWKSLLANKEAQKHKTSKKELDNMRALIARDRADASLAGLSADRRFATAYNAALRAANIPIACAGYRIVSKVGHYRVSLESTKRVLGKTAHKYADYFETCRGKAILSTSLSPMLRPTQKQTRSSFKQSSFMLRSKTGLQKTTLL